MGYMYLYVMSCRFRDQHRPFRVKEIPRIIIVLLINRNAKNRISAMPMVFFNQYFST